MKNLDEHWKVTVKEGAFKKIKAHIRYYNELGQSTNKGISLELDQFKWLVQQITGVQYFLHTIYFIEHALIFKETKNGFLYGIILPVNVIHALESYKEIITKLMS